MHPGFDERNGILRFMVPMGPEHIAAFISETTWWARHDRGNSDTGMVELYLQNQAMINAIVARKVNAGARQPVVLMARDL